VECEQENLGVLEVVPGVDYAADAVGKDVYCLGDVTDCFCVEEFVVVAKYTSQTAELRMYDQLKCGVGSYSSKPT
jgi:hypothetical protein